MSVIIPKKNNSNKKFTRLYRIIYFSTLLITAMSNITFLDVFTQKTMIGLIIFNMVSLLAGVLLNDLIAKQNNIDYYPPLACSNITLSIIGGCLGLFIGGMISISQFSHHNCDNHFAIAITLVFIVIGLIMGAIVGNSIDRYDDRYNYHMLTVPSPFSTQGCATNTLTDLPTL